MCIFYLQFYKCRQWLKAYDRTGIVWRILYWIIKSNWFSTWKYAMVLCFMTFRYMTSIAFTNPIMWYDIVGLQTNRTEDKSYGLWTNRTETNCTDWLALDKPYGRQIVRTALIRGGQIVRKTNRTDCISWYCCKTSATADHVLLLN